MAAGLGSCSGQARAQVHQGGSGISQACEALAFLAHAPASATSTTAIPTSIGSSKLRSFSLRFLCSSLRYIRASQAFSLPCMAHVMFIFLVLPARTIVV